MKAFSFIIDKNIVDKTLSSEKTQSTDTAESHLTLINHLLEDQAGDFFNNATTLDNANLLTNENGLSCFNILKEYPQVNLEILTILKEKNLLNDDIDFSNIANHLHSHILVDIFYQLDSLDLLTVENINKIVEYNSVYAIGEVINKINLCPQEIRQNILDNLIEKENCLKALNLISDKLYSNFLQDKFLAENIIIMINNHYKPFVFINILNILTELDLNFSNNIQEISEHKFLLLLEETIKRISIFNPEQRQEILETLINQQDCLKTINLISDKLYSILVLDNNLAHDIIKIISTHTKPLVLINILNMLIEFDLNFSINIHIISKHKFLQLFEETIKKISIFKPERRQEILEELIDQENFLKAIHCELAPL